MTTATDEVDVEAAGERVSAILRPNGADVERAQETKGRAEPKPRRTRSDAGKPRPAKAETPGACPAEADEGDLPSCFNNWLGLDLPRCPQKQQLPVVTFKRIRW